MSYMRIRIILSTIIALGLICNYSFAQIILKGTVINSADKKPVPFANVIITGTNTGGTTNENGEFEISNVKPGYHTITASCIGYNSKVSDDIFITSDKIPAVTIELTPRSTQLQEIIISKPAFVNKSESPLSMRTIGVREIEKSPGGNRDISKVLQSSPGVAVTPGFRNDIIIRGGSPSENKFYLDGIEVPVINHFQTQGASGGPVGILNVDLLNDVEFHSGAFPAKYENGLSSVIAFKQKTGNTEKPKFRVTGGSSDFGFTSDGPLSNSTSYIISIRRSYLQFLFKTLKLPFLPTFSDAQFKTRTKLNDRSYLTLIGIGAIDDFKLNASVNEDITDPEKIELNNYILGNLPTYSQWNYAVGGSYQYITSKQVFTISLSRNELSNSSEKYKNNDDSDLSNLISSYNSNETENKLRFDQTYSIKSWKLNAGVNVDHVFFTTKSSRYQTTSSGAILLKSNTDLSFIKYGLYSSVSRSFFKARLNMSFGLRADANNYSRLMNNIINQVSPRFSASYSLTEKWELNFSSGIYYQLPPYTALGYSNNQGDLLNSSRLQYISNEQLNLGVAYYPDANSKFSIETFYKNYKQYPYSLSDSVSLANLGSDFGVIGSDLLSSISKGIAEGIEFSAERKAENGIFGILAYTFVYSRFSGSTSVYKPSSWDNRHILTTTLGKRFNKNFDLGIRWRYLSGRPYTPYDIEKSSLKENWDVRGQGILDYSKVNSIRLDPFHQLDIRFDKSWYFQKWSLQLYLDIQNVYNFKSDEPDILNVRTNNADGKPITDPNDSNRYLIYYIKDTSGTILPSIGFIIDF